MSHTVCVLMDPLATRFPHWLDYQVKARALAQTLPVTNIVTVPGNNQAHITAWNLFSTLYPSHALVAHRGALASSVHNPTFRQFTPLYLKWSTSRWDKTTGNFITTIKPTAILAEGNKDQLLDVNALADAWTRASNTRKHTPDFVMILDPFNRIAGPPINGATPPPNVISTNVLHQAIKDCTARGFPYSIVV